MSSQDDTLLEQLQLENKHLSDQVLQLVRSERLLIQANAQFEQQIQTYRQLNEVGQKLNTTFSEAEILTLMQNCILDDLKFERCLVLKAKSGGRSFGVLACAGYEEELSLPPIEIPIGHRQIAQLLSGHIPHVTYSREMTEPNVQSLREIVQMEEYVVFTIRVSGMTIPYLVVIGNRPDRAKYFTRVTADGDCLIGLQNLFGQVEGSLLQARLYGEAQARAEALQQALQNLQYTQAQLIQSEKMSSLGQLVAGVAHEINNPVNFIAGNVGYAAQYFELLLGLLSAYEDCYPTPPSALQAKIEAIDLPYLKADLPKLLSSMEMGTDRIQEIVLSLRDFSRMDESDFKFADLHDGLESTLLILQHRLKRSVDRPTIAIIRNYGDLPKVNCYPGQLNQVFMNLLSNAIDALDEAVVSKGLSTPEIQIQTLVCDHQVQVRIQDNGMGIPAAVAARIFDPFFTTKPVGKGTGMGLSISYQIINDRHHGKLWCRSAQDGGTEFVIEIPVSLNSNPRFLDDRHRLTSSNSKDMFVMQFPPVSVF
jgi:signal transduction histidine kinase